MKHKISSILVLLLIAVSGAWAKTTKVFTDLQVGDILKYGDAVSIPANINGAIFIYEEVNYGIYKKGATGTTWTLSRANVSTTEPIYYPSDEAIYSIPWNLWQKMKVTPFYVTVKGSNPQIKVMTGWWSDPLSGGEIKPGDTRLVDNSDGTFTLTVNLAGEALASAMDGKHLYFNGTGYSVEEIYLIEESKKVSIWVNDGSYGEISDYSKYRFCPVNSITEDPDGKHFVFTDGSEVRGQSRKNTTPTTYAAIPYSEEGFVITAVDFSDTMMPNVTIEVLGLPQKTENDYTWSFIMPSGDVEIEIEYYPGYEITVAAGEYATLYVDEAVITEDSDAEIYTIANVTETEAILSDPISVAPEKTPLLIYNKGEVDKTFLLIPYESEADVVEAAKEFQGTATAKEMPASSATIDYYVCTGSAFIWVKEAGTIAANRCWLQIGDQPAAARAKTRSITGGGDTTGLKAIDNEQLIIDKDDYYDLQGRKVVKPKNKGIYIHNGKKVVVK